MSLLQLIMCSCDVFVRFEKCSVFGSAYILMRIRILARVEHQLDPFPDTVPGVKNKQKHIQRVIKYINLRTINTKFYVLKKSSILLFQLGLHFSSRFYFCVFYFLIRIRNQKTSQNSDTCVDLDPKHCP